MDFFLQVLSVIILNIVIIMSILDFWFKGVCLHVWLAHLKSSFFVEKDANLYLILL